LIGPSSRTTPIAFLKSCINPPRERMATTSNSSKSTTQTVLPGHQPLPDSLRRHELHIPGNTLIPGGAFFVVAASPQGIQNVYGLTANVFLALTRAA